MALTRTRVLPGVILAWLALAVLLLPPRGAEQLIYFLPWAWNSGWWFGGNPPARDSLVAENNRLTRSMQAAGEEWLLLSWRDSILAQPGLVARARGGDPVLLVKGRVLPNRLDAFRSAIAQSWHRLPRRDPRAWTVVAIVPDSIPGPTGQQLGAAAIDQRYVLYSPLVPEPGCVLLVSAATVNGRSLSMLLEDLAPCGWRAAFGPPAPAVSGWLRRAGWAQGDRAPWASGQGATPWISLLAARFGGDLEALPRHEAFIDFLSAEAGREGRIFLAGCLAGRAQACERVVSAPIPRGRSSGLPGVRRGYWMPPGDALVRTGQLGAMLEAFGPDRFEAFWNSPKPVGEAIRELTGVSEGEWIRDLVRARLGQAEPRRGRSFVPAILSLLAGALVVGAAAWSANRRQVL